jgi:hypothetical protein
MKCKESRISVIPVVLQKRRELFWTKQKLVEDLSVLEFFEIIKFLDSQIIRDGNTRPEREGVN